MCWFCVQTFTGAEEDAERGREEEEGVEKEGGS